MSSSWLSAQSACSTSSIKYISLVFWDPWDLPCLLESLCLLSMESPFHYKWVFPLNSQRCNQRKGKSHICEFHPKSHGQLCSRTRPSVSAEGSRLKSGVIVISKCSVQCGVPPSVPQQVQNVSSDPPPDWCPCVSSFASPTPQHWHGPHKTQLIKLAIFLLPTTWWCGQEISCTSKGL